MKNRHILLRRCVVRLAFALALPLGWCVTGAGATPRTTELDQQALIALENQWLENEHDPAALERILAPDFVHAVVSGYFLTKAEHISWSTKHPPPPNLKSRFEKLEVRMYGDVGIASGIVVTSDSEKDIDRTVFTDVFAYRNGRWQAIHAQETKVDRPPMPFSR
jgi:hypothetical protein